MISLTNAPGKIYQDTFRFIIAQYAALVNPLIQKFEEVFVSPQIDSVHLASLV